MYQKFFCISIDLEWVEKNTKILRAKLYIFKSKESFSSPFFICELLSASEIISRFSHLFLTAYARLFSIVFQPVSGCISRACLTWKNIKLVFFDVKKKKSEKKKYFDAFSSKKYFWKTLCTTISNTHARRGKLALM